MKKTRRDIIRGMLAISAAGLVGCSSQMKFRDSNNKPSHYNEHVSSVLITEDGSMIVVMTDSYHYVFNMPDIIAKALKANFHDKLNAEFEDFTLNEYNDIFGTVKLRLKGASKKDISDAVEAGFSETPDGAEVEVALSGTRYDAGNIYPHAQYRLKREYKIRVHVDAGKAVTESGNRDDSLMTPIYYGASGVLFILALPLILPFWYRHCNDKNFKDC
jgi:hypothetical protein